MKGHAAAIDIHVYDNKEIGDEGVAAIAAGLKRPAGLGGKIYIEQD